MKYTEDIFGKAIEENILLREKFMEPPFSVLDTKGGQWQARKRAWKALGIKSEVSREGVVVINDSFNGAAYGRGAMPEVSIFDPALCELMYRWFCPEGGTILDPFSGGSVRGIVAHYLGYKYTGIDIRQEQIDSNREQALDILPITNQPQWYVGDSNIVLDDFISTGAPELTPIQEYGDIYVKREDFYNCHGANGAKARTALFLITRAMAAGFAGVTTAGSRQSPQINIAAHICHSLNIPFVAHCPKGDLSPELLSAQALGAEIIQHTAGYNSVIIARCKEYAKENNYFELPFGMTSEGAVQQTAEQVANIPAGIKRIVISVGSGMNLAGLLHGLQAARLNIPVLAVQVGADPTKALDTFAPEGWRDMVTIIQSGSDYHTPELFNTWQDIVFDPIYEAKCLAHLQPGDLFWVVGIRASLLPEGTKANSYSGARVQAPKKDMIFSCPPYADLEVYSDLPGDISNLNYEEFLVAYTSIIRKSVAMLKHGGYAAWVVGDMRDKKGFYRDFISHTKRAFIEAGALLYNDAVLLQPLGTAMLRANRVFSAGEKLIKVHENVLVFKKP